MAADIPLELLTNSRMASARFCMKSCWFKYELGWRRIRVAKALGMGSAMHIGRERYNKGDPDATAIVAALKQYEEIPEWADPYDWAVERETVQALLAGYFWRYGQNDIEVIVTEQVFKLPLVNPDTDTASRTFLRAGKIDGIGRLPDGRIIVDEFKSTGDPIDSDSGYWQRLRCDAQCSMYVCAARDLGHPEINVVIYDVVHKPGMGPKRATPIDKRKYKKDNTLYANMREEDETPDEFGKRLLEDIGERPDFYYQRREVPRLEDELTEFRHDMWNQAKMLIEAKKHCRWFRNVSKFTCPMCEFNVVCLESVRVDPDAPPAGFEILENVHPELEESDHGESEEENT